MDICWKLIQSCWFFFWGNTFGRIIYDSKYLKGRWFEGKACGLRSVGWRWVTKDMFSCLFCSDNNKSKYPINCNCTVVHPSNIEFDPDDLNNFQTKGSYFQAIGKIKIGKGTFIAPNVGLITSNHDLMNPDKHLPPKAITLGKQCWIGMNSVLLPGVVLGDHTIVGAGSIVTKSFPDGYCVIAGNPAKKIRELDVMKEMSNCDHYKE